MASKTTPEDELDKLLASYIELRRRCVRITVRGAPVPDDLRAALAGTAAEIAEYLTTVET